MVNGGRICLDTSWVLVVVLLLLSALVDFKELAKYLEFAAYSWAVCILKQSPFLLFVLAPLNGDSGDDDEDNSLSPSSVP